MTTRIKKAKIPRLFIEKLGNSGHSWLFPVFSTSIQTILSLFSHAPQSGKALLKMIPSMHKLIHTMTRSAILTLTNAMVVSFFIGLTGCSSIPQPKPASSPTSSPSKTQLNTETIKYSTSPQALEQSARQALANGDFYQYITLGQQLLNQVSDPNQQASIEYQLWQTLQHIPTETLTEWQISAEEHPDAVSDIQPWLNFITAWHKHQGILRWSALKNEIALTDTPALYQPLQALTKQQVYTSPLHQIAVLLPLSGKYRLISLQIRNGIIKNMLSHYPDLTLKFYDTADSSDPHALISQAKSEGADWVIGPLLKNHLQALTNNPPSQLTALNQIDTAQPFLQFSLKTPSEAIQIENKLCQAQYRHIGVLASQAGGDLELGQQLTYFWRQIPLHHTAFNSYPTHRPNLRKALGGLINETQSQSRMANLKWLLQEKLAFIPRTRKDLQAIVLVGNRKRVAVFKPQFKFFNLQLPIYGSSKLTPKQLTHAKPIKDLSQVTFPTFPAALKTSQAQNTLEAFGWDSLTLTLKQHLLAPSLCLNEGLTGKLQIDRDHFVDRQLIWAKYNRKGQAEPIDPLDLKTD